MLSIVLLVPLKRAGCSLKLIKECKERAMLKSCLNSLKERKSWRFSKKEDMIWRGKESRGFKKKAKEKNWSWGLIRIWLSRNS